MKDYLKYTAAAVALLGMAAGSHAALAAEATGTANASVVAALQIAPGDALDFGDFAPLSGSTSTVVIFNDGSPRDGTADLINTDNGQPGTFVLTGEDGASAQLDTPDTSVTLSGPGADMTATLVYDQETGISLTGGTATVTVGGTLTVGDGQTAGDYTGTYTVNASYEP